MSNPVSKAIRIALVSGALLAGAACSDPAPSGEARDVLVIGNSLVAGLAETLAAIAELDGRTMNAVGYVSGGTALIDVVNTADLDDRLRQGWDYVILSQGPTSHQVCRDTLILAAELFDDPIRREGGQPALLMSWPAAADSGNGRWERVRESFQLAADAVDGVFVPAGEAWRAAWRADPSLPLYDTDGYHPAPLGTFLMALTAYGRMTGRDVRHLPPVARLGDENLEFPEATVRLLQEAAHSANEQFGDGEVPGLPGLPTSGPFRC
jgi:hypothetical protein